MNVSCYFKCMIRLALIGVGYWGKNYLSTVSQMKTCKITHICAKTEKTLFDLPEKYDKTTDYKEILKNKDIDGVIIATPASTHFSIAKSFISVGVPVLVEKPFTSRFQETLILEKIIRSKKALIMVGHEYLYNPAYLKLKELLSLLGSIHTIETEAGNWWPFHTDISMLWNWGPHDIAMLLDILGELPQTVTAWGLSKKRSEKHTEDTIYANLEFMKLKAIIKLSRILPIKKRSMLISGEKGSISYNELVDNKLELFTRNNTNIIWPQYSTVSPLEKQIEVFVDAIKKVKQPTTDVAHAVLVARVLDAIERSIDMKKTIYINK